MMNLEIDRVHVYYFLGLLAAAFASVAVLRWGELDPPLALIEFIALGYLFLFLFPGLLGFSLLWVLLSDALDLSEVRYSLIVALSALTGLFFMWEIAGLLEEYAWKKHELSTYITFAAFTLLSAFFLAIWHMLLY